MMMQARASEVLHCSSFSVLSVYACACNTMGLAHLLYATRIFYEQFFWSDFFQSKKIRDVFDSIVFVLNPGSDLVSFD